MTASPFVRQAATTLLPDARRVIARLFLPGEELHRSRAAEIVDRVLALPESEVEALAQRLLSDFGNRHDGYRELMLEHARIASTHSGAVRDVSPARTVVLGASFTAEYAVEAAALCNPSAFLHPDQDDLSPGVTRVAVSVRAIGEGHISSIGFATAVVGPGRQWSFVERVLPATTGTTTPGRWRRAQLRAVLLDQGHIDDISAGVLRALPVEFGVRDLEDVLDALLRDLRERPGSARSVELLRRLVWSAYQVDFPAGVRVDQQVLFPAAAEESNGMEDARFTRFVEDDGSVDHRATYTAYDGATIAPRLLVSRDLRTFTSHRLAGPAARNKGMALFPRRVGGRHLALCRSDGESMGVTSSSDGFVWREPVIIQRPVEGWEVVQVGNCGPPIETALGWLVMTHGVGPMRTYAIGALLLDLDDPTKVVARSKAPLLEPDDAERDGYVPNVVYSCGALAHDGVLWLPFGVDDNRIGVASAALDELLDALS